MASGEGQSNPSTSGDAGRDHHEDFGNEYGPLLPTQEELREMEHRRLVGEATNLMLNFAKDPKLAKYMSETAFQDVQAQLKATTISPPKPDSKKQYSKKELEAEIDARLARILGAQKQGKKHDRKRKKSTDFNGYLGSQSTFDKAKKHKKHAAVPSSFSSSSSESSSESSEEERRSKKRSRRHRHGKGKRKSRSCRADDSSTADSSTDGINFWSATARGTVLRCDATGKILMKCFLSGMPDLKLGLNDKIGLEKEAQIKARPARSGKTIELDDVTFHQCVNLTRFNSEKTVSFVPPDGEFELMKYRITEGISLPFRVFPSIKELGRTRMEVNVKVKSVFGAKMFALGVVVKVPVPKQTAKASFQVTNGKAKYNATLDCLVWKVRKFPGQTEATMSAEVELISTIVEKKSWTRPPIQMEFQVPMFTASGLRVRFLKVWEKSGYSTVEWVRYITRAGSYEIRC
ncbi:hypothetical protein L7F22_029106 [Adiantum nelumboides]|nr:hypothetical protein [Adiantum nelumboides]